MDIKEEIIYIDVVVENVGGFDGPPICEDMATNSSNMENVWPKLGNSLGN
jgi:hypothetical protein